MTMGTYFGITEFTVASALHFPAELCSHGLHAVADSQHRRTKGKYDFGRARRICHVNRLWTTRENNTSGVELANSLIIHEIVGVDFAIYADFPDPSNFYGPILGCAGAVQGGWNWSWYCNEDLDKLATEADSMTDPAKSADRAKLWSEIYGKIMEDAPWVPVFNEQRFTMKSARMGGDDSLYVDPVSIPVNYDYVYVTE